VSYTSEEAFGGYVTEGAAGINGAAPTNGGSRCDQIGRIAAHFKQLPEGETDQNGKSDA
jgi:hypothetical protein